MNLPAKDYYFDITGKYYFFKIDDCVFETSQTSHLNARRAFKRWKLKKELTEEEEVYYCKGKIVQTDPFDVPADYITLQFSEYLAKKDYVRWKNSQWKM